MKNNIKSLLNDIYLLAKNENSDIEAQLAMYQFCASSYWHNYSGTFVHREFENDLVTISEKIIDIELDSMVQEDHILHVMTEAYDTGGHTRVVENWIKATPHRHSVFFNNPYSPMPNFLVNAIKSKEGSIILNNKDGFVQKAKYLAQVGNRFKYVVLHHHPHDILPLLAFGTSKFLRPIFFYNHADHVWGCGYSISDKIIEICSQGIHHSINYRGIPSGASIFGGIPLELPEKPVLNFDNNCKIMVSMASAYKFKPIDNLSFQHFIDLILTYEPNTQFYGIGVSCLDEAWQELLSKFPKRIHLVGVLQKNEAHEILKQATLYLDSFPLASPTALIEAMSLGIPVLAYASPIQHMDAYKQYSYNNIDKLYNEAIAILNYSNEERLNRVMEAWSFLEEWHSLKTFAKRIEDLNKIKEHIPLTLSENIVADDYSETYTDFLYQLLYQQNFKFDPGQLHLLTYDQKKKLTIKISSYSLLENSIAMYGNEDWYDLITCNTKLFSQLFLDHSNGFSEKNSIKLPVAKNTNIQEFIFDLSKKSMLTGLRLDPLNDSCVIEIEELKIIRTDGSELDLMSRIRANVCSAHGKSYFFDHNDPQITFEGLCAKELTGAAQLIATFRYPHIARDAVHVCVNQIIADNNHLITVRKSKLK